MKRWIWVLAGFTLACNELPSPPTTIFSAGLYRDSAGVLHDSRTGLYRDFLGFWRDTLVNQPFMDVPEPYREFWHYCATCHSGFKYSPYLESVRAKRAMQLNNWDEIVAYGPEKLFLAALRGGMPLATAVPVPDYVIERVHAYLAAHWDTTGVPPAPPQPVTTTGIVDTFWVADSTGIHKVEFLYKPAQRLMDKYCAECHARDGNSPYQKLTWSNSLQIDSFPVWRGAAGPLIERMDPVYTWDLMPPFYGAHQPTRAERDTLLQWLNRGAPNTVDGR